MDSRRDRNYCEFSSCSEYIKTPYLYNGVRRFSLEAASDAKHLLFNKSISGRENKISIEQCDQIPDEGSFLFAEFSNVSGGLHSPIDVTSEMRITDRFGKRVLTHSTDVSPHNNGAFIACDGHGNFIELLASQAFYTDTEKQRLNELQLNGKYQLESNFIRLLCILH